MQSSLIRLPRSAQRALASLTLCAIATPSSPAFAQSIPGDAVTALLGSSAGDDERNTAGAHESSPDADADFAFTLGAAPVPLALTLPKLSLQTVATAEPQQAAAPARAPDADEGSGLRTAGFVAGGVGLVGLALFAVAGLGAKSAYDKLDSDCGAAPCTDEAHRSDIEGGRMLQTAANIGLATGLTGLGVGATLLVLGSSADKRGPSASVSANGGMITYGGQF